LNTREVARQYRLNQWTEKILECRKSGQTVSAWCAEHNVNPKSYYYWLKRVRLAACEALPVIGDDNQPIVPVKLPVPPKESDLRQQQSSAAIILHFGTVLVELRNGASPILVENTLKALHHVR
jgi:hypothetical protein